MKTLALKFTYDDYRALPQTGPRYQLIDGDLIVSPSPSLRHQRIVRRLLKVLSDYAESCGAGEALCAPFDVLLSDVDTPQPDLLFVSKAHRARLLEHGVHGPPDLVVEVLSEDRAIDLKIKRKLYARHGIPEYWVVDPDANTVQIYRLRKNPRAPVQTFGIHESLESPTFPGLRIPLAPLFAP
jgi:Uma2 family endonuclease